MTHFLLAVYLSLAVVGLKVDADVAAPSEVLTRTDVEVRFVRPDGAVCLVAIMARDAAGRIESGR